MTCACDASAACRPPKIAPSLMPCRAPPRVAFQMLGATVDPALRASAGASSAPWAVMPANAEPGEASRARSRSDSVRRSDAPSGRSVVAAMPAPISSSENGIVS